MSTKGDDARLGRGLYGMADVGALERREVSLEDGVRALLDGGAPIVQLRWKDASAGPMLKAARLLVARCKQYGALAIVNDRVDIAVASGAAGVHLGQDDLFVAQARSLLPAGALVGVSTHDLRQVDAALADGADYIGYGPVFSTATKTNPDPVVGLDGLAGAVARVAGRVPVVAIGGIDLPRVSSVAATGADLAAVVSDIIGHADIAGRARAVHEAMNKGRAAV